MFEKIKNKSLKTVFIVLIILVLAILSIFAISNIDKGNEVEALSKYGSRGSEVTQIQTKLKRWGYYKGNIDTVFL